MLGFQDLIVLGRCTEVRQSPGRIGEELIGRPNRGSASRLPSVIGRRLGEIR